MSTKGSTHATSTKVTNLTESDSKISRFASPVSSSRFMNSIKSTSSKMDNFKLPEIPFSRFSRIDSREWESKKIPISYSSINASYNTPLPKICPPNYYYRSNRSKNNALMDSVMAIDEEIMKESQSLEELKTNMKEYSMSLGISKPASRMRNSSSQINMLENKINFSIIPNIRYQPQEGSPSIVKSRNILNTKNIQSLKKKSKRL